MRRGRRTGGKVLVEVVVDAKAWDKDIDGLSKDSIEQRKDRLGTIYQNGHKVQ